MFPVGFVVYALYFIYAVRSFCTKSKVAEHFILSIVIVLLPLFLMGYFMFYFPVRYSFQIAPFFILSCFTGAYSLIRENKDSKLIYKISRYDYLIPCILALVMIKPFVLAKILNPNCVDYPDHRGAASFINSLSLVPSDIVIAEDVLQQVYYNVKVNYWLRGFDNAKGFLKEDGGVLEDIYTGTPLIGTGKELIKILNDYDVNNVYIIGSGETFDKKEYYLSNGILDTIKMYMDYSEVIYKGCDNKTFIWHFSHVQK